MRDKSQYLNELIARKAFSWKALRFLRKVYRLACRGFHRARTEWGQQRHQDG
jgi:hypothetical protein